MDGVRMPGYFGNYRVVAVGEGWDYHAELVDSGSGHAGVGDYSGGLANTDFHGIE